MLYKDDWATFIAEEGEIQCIDLLKKRHMLISLEFKSYLFSDIYGINLRGQKSWKWANMVFSSV